jgi:hypothetical protein
VRKKNMMTKIEFDKQSGKFLGFYDGKMVKKSVRREWVEEYLNQLTPENTKSKDAEFGINDRFNFVSDLVSMVAQKTAPSAIITGEGGLGKTFTVIKTLEANGLKNTSSLLELEDESDEPILRDESMFTVVKGFSTAKGLYRILYEHQNSTLVFDDCDSVMKDPVALNLLKGALDSYDERIISWNAEMSDKEDLPKSFRFEGQVIFISNLAMNTLSQALRSRSFCVDLSMTMSQKIERMDTLVTSGEFMPEVALSAKKDALALINKFKDNASEVSLRTLIKVVKIRVGGAKNWEKLAQYVLSN